MCWIKTQQEVLWKLYGVPLNLFHVSWCAYTNNWQDVKHTSCIISIFYENFYLFKRWYIFLFKEALFLDNAAPFFECKKETDKTLKQINIETRKLLVLCEYLIIADAIINIL